VRQWKHQRQTCAKGEAPSVRGGESIALARLWEQWRGPDHKEELLCINVIIIIVPNETMARARPDARDPPALRVGLLAGPTNDDTESLAKLLVPAPADLLVARPVSTAVNGTRNNSPELIEPADAE
jgi:putative SOS response-associated peptidase YedK